MQILLEKQILIKKNSKNLNLQFFPHFQNSSKTSQKQNVSTQQTTIALLISFSSAPQISTKKAVPKQQYLPNKRNSFFNKQKCNRNIIAKAIKKLLEGMLRRVRSKFFEVSVHKQTFNLGDWLNLLAAT
jgi:hypothetical protein